MSELIWFSIPGAMALFGLWASRPSMFSGDNAEILAVAAAPVVGYCIHQLARSCYEVLHFFRSVYKMMRVDAAPDRLTRRRAALIWSSTLFSKPEFKDFRDHSRSYWSYIMSFLSVFLGSFCGLLLCCVGTNVAPWKAWGLAGVGLFFLLKTALTFRLCSERERAFFWRQRSEFNDVRSKLATMP